MSEQAIQQKVWIERSTVSRRCQLKYNDGSLPPKACQNTSHWRIMPKDLAICRTCALYLASNNHAEVNAAILAPLLSTGVEPAPPRESNPLNLLCVECWQVCVLSENGKWWLCPNGHE